MGSSLIMRRGFLTYTIKVSQDLRPLVCNQGFFFTRLDPINNTEARFENDKGLS